MSKTLVNITIPLVHDGVNKRKVGGVGFRPAKLCKRTTHSKSMKSLCCIHF
jgi:hypothetical protein